MPVELRHVRCFLSVVRHLHFARAAEELGIAPPALTRQIQEAERLLGVRLFHRTKRSVALSATGEAYLNEAVSTLEHLTHGAERAAMAERGELERIVIGYGGGRFTPTCCKPRCAAFVNGIRASRSASAKS